MKIEEAYSRGRLLGWRLTCGNRCWLVTADGTDLPADSNFGLPETTAVHYRHGYERPVPEAPTNWGDAQLADCGLSEAAITTLDNLDVQTILDLDRLWLDLDRVETIPAAVLTEIAEVFSKRTGEPLLPKWMFITTPGTKCRRKSGA